MAEEMESQIIQDLLAGKKSEFHSNFAYYAWILARQQPQKALRLAECFEADQAATTGEAAEHLGGAAAWLRLAENAVYWSVQSGKKVSWKVSCCLKNKINFNREGIRFSEITVHALKGLKAAFNGNPIQMDNAKNLIEKSFYGAWNRQILWDGKAVTGKESLARMGQKGVFSSLGYVWSASVCIQLGGWWAAFNETWALDKLIPRGKSRNHIRV